MKKFPEHIAIIMDGNGRWAAHRGLPRTEGHRRGVEVVEETCRACKDLGVRYLTLYAFSDENWNRPQDEVVQLMSLLAHFLTAKKFEMKADGIRFNVIGDLERLPQEVRDAITDAMSFTVGSTTLTMTVALSYGSRQEICRAVARALSKGAKDITPEVLSANLDTSGLPDPDLLIRTSGEKRISNYLLWQIAYAELYFTDTMWPDFDKKALQIAIDDYLGRERRFGKTSEQVKTK